MERPLVIGRVEKENSLRIEEEAEKGKQEIFCLNKGSREPWAAQTLPETLKAEHGKSAD